MQNYFKKNKLTTYYRIKCLWAVILDICLLKTELKCSMMIKEQHLRYKK